MKLTMPRNWICIKRGFSSTHKGIDLMWASAYGGANAPIYAMEDGKVLALVDGLDNMKGSNSYGNCINISHGDNVYTFYAHLLKSSLIVKVGDTVKKGQIIAKMGNSGNSNGNHLHFEVRKGGSSNAFVVDPLLCTYLDTSWQTVFPATDKVYKILKYTPIATKGTPVARDTNRNQIQIVSTIRRARKTPSLGGEVYGYMNAGIYNILSTTVADGYTWYQVEEDLHFAYFADTDVLLYADDEKDKVIAEQKAEIENLSEKIETAVPEIRAALSVLT